VSWGFVLGGYVGELVYWYFFVVFVFSLSVFCCCLLFLVLFYVWFKLKSGYVEC